jgi:hypothetical protein
MKWIAFLIVTIMCITLCAMSQTDRYSTQTTGGAPIPQSPTSPNALDLQVPSITSSPQPPSPQERSQELIKVDQQLAYSAPSGLGATATSPTYAQMIVPPGGAAANSLYISYAPQTVTGCNLYASLPLWLQTTSTGNAWFYEWYPNGMLDTNYAGNIYAPGWYKRWFFADVPGWHILQYYCNGWSNYAYVYVYGPNYWVNPKQAPNPDKLKCEQNPLCNWVNGKCLCTGLIPPAQAYATGLIPPHATGLIIPDSESSGHTHATGLIPPV